MPDDCIFCKIGTGEIKGDVLDHDDMVLVLNDLHPHAPVHLLVLPFRHISSVADLGEADGELISRMVLVANRAAAQQGLAEKGYRLAINCGIEGGQTVEHLHMHVLGGRQLSGALG